MGPSLWAAQRGQANRVGLGGELIKESVGGWFCGVWSGLIAGKPGSHS
ncbi:hypothetical protein C4K03_5837 [Pseudomonas synxantha]|uniref:Uncharacterized protein n=1 Tax=Pseudomonas synxantha TaxID=47883 RepID=A0A3G7UEQ7_9PSED|nr:hypothetical protein C4K03_5837 [Pseudomonas synxantha]